MKIEKTHFGQKAGGFLKTASIVEMASGYAEIIVTAKNGREYFARRGVREAFDGSLICDVLLLCDVYGIVAALETSTTAYNTMVRLERKADNRL